MEQKKTLWIIAAAGVFLLVVIGAAMILYSPASRTIPAVAAVPQIRQNGGWTAPPAPVNQDEQTPGTAGQQNPGTTTVQQTAGVQSGNKTDASHVNEMTVIAGTTNVYGINTNTAGTSPATTIDLNTLKNAQGPSENVTAQNEAGEQALVTAQSKQPEKTSVTEQPEQTVPAKTSYKPAKSIKPALKPVVPVRKSAAVPEPKYWVQAASFTGKKSADNARAVLDQNRIPSEVFTYRDSKNRIFYRVRIGPYTTQSEAEYWRNRIVQINEFKDTQSYITNSSAPAK